MNKEGRVSTETRHTGNIYTTLEEICSLIEGGRTLPSPHTPIIIDGESVSLSRFSPAIPAALLREGRVHNPIVYVNTAKTLTADQKIDFLDAGGDRVIDAADTEHSQAFPLSLLEHYAQVFARHHHNLKEKHAVLNYEFGVQVHQKDAAISINGTFLDLTAYQYTILKWFFWLNKIHRGVTSKHFIQTVYNGNAKKTQPLVSHLSHINRKLAPFSLTISSVRNSIGDRWYIMTSTKKSHHEQA